jgi:DNA-binding response OmpR family regulator
MEFPAVTLGQARGTGFGSDKRPTVLVVEDEILIRMSLCDDLREAGFRVIEAANADEGLGLIRAGLAIDALLTDVRMPGELDGLALAGAARAALPSVALMLMSSAIAEGQRVSLAPFEFVDKPFETDHVIARLRSLTGLQERLAVAAPEQRFIPLPTERPPEFGDEAEA